MIDKTEQTERTELTTKWKAAIAPPEELSIWEWADKNVILGQRFPTAYKGTYRSNLTPYLRGIMEALQDPLINTIVIAKGAQTGATLLAYIYILYVIVNDPSPLLLVMDSENNARSASEQRLIPLLEDTEVTRKELPSNPDDFKKLEYNLTRMNIKLTGANSAGNLASRSCRYLICDEIDKYPPIVNEESDPISLAILRTKTFWNRKVILISTPTNEDGAIWKHYLQGNQCKYYIPCPNCKQEFIPEWSTIKFDKDKEPQDAGENAFIECPNCNNKIADKEKNTCIAKGKWKPTETPKQKGIASFHCPSILSPWTSISHLVTKFLMIEGFSNALKDFINGELGEPWKEVKEVIRDTELTKKQGRLYDIYNY